MHFIFKARPGVHHPNTVNTELGLDTRGDRGWIAYYGFTDNTPLAEAPDWMWSLSRSAQAQTSLAPQGATFRVSPEIAEGLINASLEAIREAPEGESNNVLNVEAFKLGQLIASESITRDYAEAALFRAAKARGKPDYESRATIKSGLDGGLKKPMVAPFGTQAPVAGISIPPPPESPGRWTPSPITKYDLMNSSKLRKPQLFQDWSTEDIHITTADGGTGKTTLKLFEAICLALGERFLGFDCKQPGKTLFITGEDTDKKLAAMLGAIVRQMGLFEEAPGNDDKIRKILSSIVIKKDADLCLIAKDRQSGFLLPNTEALRKVMEAIEDVNPKMIVFDPISSFWGSEAALNDMNKAVTKFMSWIADRGICVEMINHMGKSSSANKDMTQFAGRGGSGLPSNARVSRVLRPVFEDEYRDLTGGTLTDRQSAMLCNVNKFTDGSPLYNKPFLIIRDGYLFHRVTLTPQKAREVEQEQSDTARVFTFIKEERVAGRYPTKSAIVAFFVVQEELSEARVKRAFALLEYNGHMGEKIKIADNPDMTVKDKVYVIIGDDGKEN